MRSNSRSRAILERAVAGGVTPCAVALVSGDESAQATGTLQETGPHASADTIFDLASLTKVVATLPSILRLITEGELSLEDRVGRFFSNAGWFQEPSLGEATVKQLLTHTSGLPNWRPFFAQVSDRRTALAAVLQTPLETSPGSPVESPPGSTVEATLGSSPATPASAVYSDLGFMVLGAIVERIAGERMDSFAHRHIFEPLGMTSTSFGPISGDDIAPTEDCGWRGRLLQGEVHDENAFLWEGVAGHAGLFSTAADLGRYCQAWLELDERLGREDLLVRATSEQAHFDEGTPVGLGWVLGRNDETTGRGASRNRYTGFTGTGANGFGHTGFTGTSLWIEPEARAQSLGGIDREQGGTPESHSPAGSWAVLLTNRVNPHRAARSGMTQLRIDFHEALRKNG